MSAVTPTPPAPPVVRNLLSSFGRAGGAPTPVPVPVPGPAPTPPKPLDVDRVRLVDKLPGAFNRLAHQIKEWVRRFFARIWGVPYEPGGLEEPAPLAPLDKIPRAMQGKLMAVKDALKLATEQAWRSWFAPEHFTEIFRAMGRGDVARGAELFKDEPAALLLYLHEVQWRAAHWGSIERWVNSLKNRVIPLNPKDFDPEHAKIATKRFCKALRVGFDVWELIQEVRRIRLGITREQMRLAYPNRSVFEEPRKRWFDHEPFIALFEELLEPAPALLAD